MMGGMGMGFGFIGFLFMLAFWVLLVVAVVWVARALFGNSQPTQWKNPSQDPREILDQRYARGELTREQYELMKRDIG